MDKESTRRQRDLAFRGHIRRFPGGGAIGTLVYGWANQTKNPHFFRVTEIDSVYYEIRLEELAHELVVSKDDKGIIGFKVTGPMLVLQNTRAVFRASEDSWHIFDSPVGTFNDRLIENLKIYQEGDTIDNRL